MAQHQRIHEGTARELAPFLAQHPDQRFRLIELSPEDEETVPTSDRTGTPSVAPNEGVIAALREIAELQKDMKPTDGSDTLRLIREARAGAMYGYDPTE